MLLFVMRHGPAEDDAPSGLDADRRLTPDGRELVARAAQELAKRVDPWRASIYASPFARALETADLMRSHMAPELNIAVRDELVPVSEPPLELVRELVDAGGDALVVGHQPWVEHLVRTLVAQAARASIPFGVRTAMVIGLEISPDSLAAASDRVGVGRWGLRLLLDPRKPSAR